MSALTLKEHLRAVKCGEPGHRFQDHYERSMREARTGSTRGRVIRMIIAVLALAVGLVLMVFPGPAIPFFFIAGGLMASESRTVARAMDWIEIQVRLLWKWSIARWRRLPAVARVLVAGVAIAFSFGSAYVAYRVIR